MAEVRDLLENWDIPKDIIKNFEDNHITIDHFGDLTDTLLKELCPPIAERIELSTHINDYLAQKDANADTSTQSTVSDNNNDSLNQSIDIEQSVTSQSVTFDAQELEDILNSAICIASQLPEFDLRTLLQTSPLGNSVLKFYETNNSLDRKRRSRLVDIIIKHLYTHIVKYRLKFDDYKILAAKIVSVFPRENIGTYFIPPVKKAQSIKGKPIFAKGKLVDKVRNILYQSGERKRAPKRSLNTDDNYSPSDLETKRRKIEEPTEDVLWLKINNEPWATVIEKWSDTFTYRRSNVYETIHGFLEHWPILADLRSDILINLDFDKLFPDKGLNFIKNWHKFFEKVFSLKSAEFIADEHTKTLVESLEGIKDEDERIPTQMALLTHLIPPKGRCEINKKHWKYSIQEAVESVIVLVKNTGDIEKKVNELKEKALIRKQTVQPYILINGLSFSNYTSVYLVIDHVRYQFQSVTRAFDCLFKSYHALNARYPLPGEHLYLIIQRFVYEIVTGSDNIQPHMCEILREFEPATRL